MTMMETEVDMIKIAKEVAQTELTPERFAFRNAQTKEGIIEDYKKFQDKTGLDPKLCLNVYEVLDDDAEPDMLPNDFFNN